MAAKKKARARRAKAAPRKTVVSAAGSKSAAKLKPGKGSPSAHGVRVLKAAPVTSVKLIVKDLGISKAVIGAARRAISV